MDYIVTFEDGLTGYLGHAELSVEEVERRHYAFPEARRFPLTDREKVLSAIRFFNYAKPSEEETLAKAILKRMRELGMEEANVGQGNRFRKYYKQAVRHSGYLAHHGIKGMKWGVRNAETQRRYNLEQHGGTSYSTDGKMLTANGQVVYGRKGRSHRKALRAADKASTAYRKDAKSRWTNKDDLSARGNAYTEKYNEELRKQRYQDPNGSLTAVGKKRYSNGETAYKDLKKQVRSKRAEVHGGGNRWMTNKSIGEYSKKYLDDMSKKEAAYKSSKEYKSWEKKINKLEREAESRFEQDGSDDFWEKYDKQYNDLMKQKPKRNFSSPYAAGVTITGLGAKGKKYTNGYLKGAGKDLSLSYLKDLGYSSESADYLVNQMLKKNRTLGFT